VGHCRFNSNCWNLAAFSSRRASNCALSVARDGAELDAPAPLRDEPPPPRPRPRPRPMPTHGAPAPAPGPDADADVASGRGSSAAISASAVNGAAAAAARRVLSESSCLRNSIWSSEQREREREREGKGKRGERQVAALRAAAQRIVRLDLPDP